MPKLGVYWNKDMSPDRLDEQDLGGLSRRFATSPIHHADQRKEKATEMKAKAPSGMSRVFRLMSLATVLLAGCTGAQSGNDANLSMPDGAYLLPSAEADTVLEQCSRDTPPRGNGTWQPTAADIIALERGLAAEVGLYAATARSAASPGRDALRAKADEIYKHYDDLEPAEQDKRRQQVQRMYWDYAQSMPDSEKRHLGFDPKQFDVTRLPKGFGRQYVGIIRDGRRFIYGNFWSRNLEGDHGSGGSYSRNPQIVCDGGPTFFGVEFEPATGKYTHMAFNGSV